MFASIPVLHVTLYVSTVDLWWSFSCDQYVVSVTIPACAGLAQVVVASVSSALPLAQSDLDFS